MTCYLSFDIAGTHIKYALMSASEEILEKNHVMSPKDLDDFWSAIDDIILTYRSQIQRVAFSAPDRVDIDNGIIYLGGVLTCLDDVHIKERIKENYDLPATVLNDGKAAALAKVWQGSLKGVSDGATIILGTGVGGGVIADGNLIHGVAGAGGEIGHMNVEPIDGFECTCGNKGCLETVASATGVVRVARHLAEEYEGDSSIKAAIDNGDAVTSKDIFVAAEAGDHFADSVVEKVGFYLGQATANIANILNPDSVVIGGGVSAAGEFLRSRVRKIFCQLRFPTSAQNNKNQNCRTWK